MQISWWYDNRGWNFPPINYYFFWLKIFIFFFFLAKLHITWKYIQSRGETLTSSLQKKKYTHWHSAVLTQYLQKPNNGCEHSYVMHFRNGNCDVCIINHLPGIYAHLSTDEMKRYSLLAKMQCYFVPYICCSFTRGKKIKERKTLLLEQSLYH